MGDAQPLICASRDKAETSTPLERLKRRPEFLRVAAARNSAARPGLVLQALPHKGEAAACRAVRYGLTVSRKVGNAVARNRARRRLRAAAEMTLASHGVPGVDYVLIGRRGTLHRPFATLIQDLAGAMRQTRSWRNDNPAAPSAGAE